MGSAGANASVKTYWASRAGEQHAGNCAVPVCRTSDRGIKIQFCLYSKRGNAAMKRAAVLTAGSRPNSLESPPA